MGPVGPVEDSGWKVVRETSFPPTGGAFRLCLVLLPLQGKPKLIKLWLVGGTSRPYLPHSHLPRLPRPKREGGGAGRRLMCGLRPSPLTECLVLIRLRSMKFLF